MNTRQSERARARDQRRIRGGVLAEFALLGFVVWLMLAGILEIGRALTTQQLLQHAARTIAREAARLPLAADLDFAAASQSGAFRQDVFDANFLVVDAELLQRCGIAGFGEANHAAELNAFFEGLPIGNRLLRPLMIADRRGGLQMIRYPGALLTRNLTTPPTTCADGSLFGVGIASLDSATNVVTWHPVVEENDTPPVAGGPTRGFSFADGGWVDLRVNYPFQSAGLLAAQSTGAIDPNTGRPVQTFVDANQPIAQDVDFAALNGIRFPSDEDGGVYAGPRGLGRLYAAPDASGLGRAVRPYRRLLSANAGFRREFFIGGGP